MTHGAKRSRWEQRNIVAWDGEGARVFTCHPDGTVEAKHVYNLLANSRGRYIVSRLAGGDLPTKVCLDFMLSEDTQSAIHVIFAGGYDVNMILRDLPQEAIRQLHKKGSVRWAGYRITYKHRKVFTVARLNPAKKTGADRSFVLWDVFGFFQSSFVKAIQKWLKDDATLEEIQDMKNMRSVFSPVDFDRILRYNGQECRLLVMLMQAFMAAMDEAGVRLTRFDGAGAIASVLLRRYNVKAHMGDIPEWVYRACQVAYAGGRVEAPRIGCHLGEIYRHDINSAYPSACLSLPSWDDVSWEKEGRPHPEAVACMVAIEWRYQNPAPFYPLYYRTHDGEILYPRSGTGIYWYPEYQSLSRQYREGIDYEVLYAINAYPGHPVGKMRLPFARVREDYAIRLAFKAAGNMAQEAYKLGLNSLYGKCAQQEGYRPGIEGRSDARYPTYHNLAWAGLITSSTRARVYDAGMVAPEEVIAYATDAVFSTRRISGLPVGDALGTWSVDDFEGITIVQPGVYWLLKDGEWQSKYRGFDPDSLNRDKVIRAWSEGTGKVSVKLTRFVGMGSALNRLDFAGIWRTWETQERTLDIIPKGKRQPTLVMDYANHLCYTKPTPNLNETMSHPYKIVWMDGTKGNDEEFGALNTEQKEWEDSWL